MTAPHEPLPSTTTLEQHGLIDSGSSIATGIVPEATEPNKRLKLIFGIVAIALLMGSIDQNIVATALKPIGTSLHSSVNWTAWTITAYGFGVVFIVPIAGRIADQYGRKRIFLLSVIIF